MTGSLQCASAADFLSALSRPSRDCNQVETKKEGTREGKKQASNPRTKEVSKEGGKEARKQEEQLEAGRKLAFFWQKLKHVAPPSDEDVALKHVQGHVFCHCHRIWPNCRIVGLSEIQNAIGLRCLVQFVGLTIRAMRVSYDTMSKGTTGLHSRLCHHQSFDIPACRTYIPSKCSVSKTTLWLKKLP